MSEVGENRCKTCGGMLVLDKESKGFSVCRSCGNRYRITLAEMKRLKELEAPIEEPKLFVSMSEKDVEDAKKQRAKNNAIFAIKGIMALISLFIVAIFISIMALYFEGKLSLENLEIGIIALIGFGAPAIMSIFAKVYKGKNESLILNAFMLLLFMAIFIAISYFAFVRYFIGFI